MNSRDPLAGIANGFLRSIGGVMRLAVVATAVCFSIFSLATADDAKAAMRKSTHIAAQELAPALKALAKDRGFQVVFQSEVVGATRTRGASGDLTTAEALSQLLEGTNLVYSYLDDKTVTILPASTNSPQASTQAQGKDTQGAGSADKEANKSFFDRFRLAQVDQGR